MSRSHGIKGEIFIRPFNPQSHWPSKLSSLKIGDHVFFPKTCSAHKQGFIVKLKDCDTKEKADQFKFQSVFLDKKDFISQKGENIYLAELLYFDVELSKGQLGQILAFQSDNHQDFLVVCKREPDGTLNKPSPYLIPFVPSYIQEIDFKKKKVILNLPDNFLSLFKA